MFYIFVLMRQAKKVQSEGLGSSSISCARQFIVNLQGLCQALILFVHLSLQLAFIAKVADFYFWRMPAAVANIVIK